MDNHNSKGINLEWYEKGQEPIGRIPRYSLYPIIKIIALVLVALIALLTIYSILVHPVDRFKISFFFAPNCTVKITSILSPNSKVLITMNDKCACIRSDNKVEYYKILDNQVYKYSNFLKYWMPDSSTNTKDSDALAKMLDSRNYEFKKLKWQIKDGVDLGNFYNVCIENNLDLTISCTYKGIPLRIVFKNVGFTKVSVPV